jgi:lipopolysaccharide transport system permease protein
VEGGLIKGAAGDPEITVIRPGAVSLGSRLAELLSYRELLYFLVLRNLKVRYAQAVLGAAWSILQPVLTALLMGLLLGRFAKFSTDGVPPFLFYFAAMVPWTFFANAVTSATGSLVANQQLIRKVYFPRLSLPLAAVLSAMADLVVPMLLLLGTMVVDGVPMSPGLLVALPVLLLISAVAATAIGIGFSAMNLRYRDVQVALPFLVQLGFFASPIIYPASRVPEAYRALYFLNPMAAVIDGFRAATLRTHALSWSDIAVSGTTALALLAVALVYFARSEPDFADLA